MARKKRKKRKKVSRKQNYISRMEFQYKPMHQWVFCSYSTFLKYRNMGAQVRSRKAGTGYWHYEY